MPRDPWYPQGPLERSNVEFHNNLTNQNNSQQPQGDHDMGQGAQPAAAPTPTPGTRAVAGTAKQGIGGETPVDPWADARLRPFPETQNAVLPYYTTGSFTIDAGTAEGAVKYITIRMNSIYDVLTTLTHSENPSITADTQSGTKNQPMMREWWIAIYRYWHVKHSKVRVRFWSEDKQHQEVDIFSYYHGIQDPPVVNGIATTGETVYKKFRRMHPNCYHKTLRLLPPSSTETKVYDNDVVFNNTYDDVNHINNVSEDAQAQIWHEIGTTPPLREMNTFIVQRSERSAHATAITVKFDIEVVFYTQFKELKTHFQYPYPTADFSVTDFSSQAN
jgi:hypothetical protein